jgi:hypothetical protein
MSASPRISHHGAAQAWIEAESSEMAASAPADSEQGRNSEPAAPGKSVQRKRTSRSPSNTHRLGRLRSELGKIQRPCNPEQAREEILNALARAGLAAWTLPGLDDKTTQRCADGSFWLKLVAHSVIINPWGAFRIVDLHAPYKPYFELHGCKQRPFVLPQEHQADDEPHAPPAG